MNIDPIEYGKLLHSVEAMEGKVSEMEKDIKKLLQLADQSKGGLWAGMAIASVLGGLITFFARLLLKA